MNPSTPQNQSQSQSQSQVTSGEKTSTGSNPLRLLVNATVFLDLNSSYKPINKVKSCLQQIDAVIYSIFNLLFLNCKN
jgi:hypothetical protein